MSATSVYSKSGADAQFATNQNLIAEIQRAEAAEGQLLSKSNNLSDLPNPSAARASLGIVDAAAVVNNGDGTMSIEPGGLTAYIKSGADAQFEPKASLDADTKALAANPASQLSTQLSATYGTVVEHGSTAGIARPSTSLGVRWEGTATPTNAVNGDRYLNTSTGDEQVKVSGSFIPLNQNNNNGAYAQLAVSANIKDAPALGLFFPEAHGAAGNGTGDDSTAINNCITAANAVKNAMVVLNGSYLVTSSINLQGVSDLRFGCTNGFSRTSGPKITWAGGDSGSTVLTSNATGLRICGIGFYATSATFAGRHIDFVNLVAMPQAFHIEIDHNFFTGAGALHTSIHTGGGHNYEIHHNDFYQANIHIQGTDTSLAIAQAVQACTVRRNWFEAKVATCHIADPGFNWKMDNNAVEPLASGAPGFIRLLNATPSMIAVTVVDNWCGDTTANGAWIEVAAGPFTIEGNTFGGSTAITGIKAVAACTSGSISKNRLVSASGGNLIDWGAFTHTGFFKILANQIAALQNLQIGTLPSNYLASTSTGSLLSAGLNLANAKTFGFTNAAGTGTHTIGNSASDELQTIILADKTAATYLAGTGASASNGLAQTKVWNGTSYTVRHQVDRGGVLVTGYRRTIVRQTLAANGGVIVDATVGDALITLQANATSTAMAGGWDGARVNLCYVQDATGGRTYSWPANCLFAGGVAPSDTTANKRTSCEFQWDNTASKWIEVGRAVAVG